MPDTPLPDWFQNHADDVKPAKPKWARLLPEISLRSGERLPTTAAPWIFGAAIEAEKEAIRHDLLEDLRLHADAESLDDWMSVALSRWIDSENPARNEWILAAVPPLAGGQSVKVLEQAIRVWARAKERSLALRALDAMGRVNLREVREIMPALALCVRDHAVADEAARLQTKQATATGLSKQEAADQVIPSLGLDARGERMLDFGPRQFTARFTTRLEFALFDQDGRKRSSMPAGNSKDDPAKVSSAKATWGELRTGIKRLVRTQAKRLEDSMVHGDTWNLIDFRRSWLAHPILAVLARSLVWQAENQRVRITEDSSFANIDDQPVQLPDTCGFRVAHPLHIDPAELSKWAALFADYQLFQIVPQLLRERFHPAPAEEAETRLLPGAHPPIPAGVLYGILDNDGWRLSKPVNGCFSSSWKSFRGSNVTVWISYSGLLVGGIAQSPDQTLIDCRFHSGLMDLEMTLKPGPILKLGQVPEIAYSETVRRIIRLMAAGEAA